MKVKAEMVLRRGEEMIRTQIEGDYSIGEVRCTLEGNEVFLEPLEKKVARNLLLEVLERALGGVPCEGYEPKPGLGG